MTKTDTNLSPDKEGEDANKKIAEEKKLQDKGYDIEINLLRNLLVKQISCTIDTLFVLRIKIDTAIHFSTEEMLCLSLCLLYINKFV